MTLIVFYEDVENIVMDDSWIILRWLSSCSGIISKTDSAKFPGKSSEYYRASGIILLHTGEHRMKNKALSILNILNTRILIRMAYNYTIESDEKKPNKTVPAIN